MRRLFSVAIIALIALSVLAGLYIAQHGWTIQDEGNGTFYQKKRQTAALNGELARVFGNPNPVGRGAYGETTGVSGPPRKDRLEEVTEDCVRAIKNLATSVGHRIRPHLAPPGVYFTRLYLSVPGRSGITGIRAGTRVVCVKDDGPVLLVKMGNLEFEVKRQYLTNDLDLADLAFRNDMEAQQAGQSAIAEQQRMDQEKRDEENAAFDQRQREIEAKKAAEAGASRYENPLDYGPYDPR